MPFIKSRRKVHSLGDSLALTLPAIYTKMNNIKKGETLDIYYYIDDIIIINKKNNNLKESILNFAAELEKEEK